MHDFDNGENEVPVPSFDGQSANKNAASM